MGNNNYQCVRSFQSMISKTYRASFSTLTWAHTNNYLRWCRYGCRANLITTLNGRSLLGLYITNNSLTWVQHMRICLFTKTQNWDFFMEVTKKGLFTTRIPTICSLASYIKCLFPKMKVCLPFPFEAFETKHYTILTSLMSNADLLHLGLFTLFKSG